jgi:hypothetical protein
LKVSGCFNFGCAFGHVAGGREDVIDINHSNDCVVTLGVSVPRGKYLSTQKGGSFNNKLTVLHQIGHGSEVDHDYGNKSDQSDKLTRCNTLNTNSVEDGSSPTVRIIRAEKPLVLGVAVSYKFPSNLPKTLRKFAIFILNLVQ